MEKNNWIEFQSELATLHRNARNSQGKIFDQMRDQCKMKLPVLISDLHAADPANPAFCGVSLLRVLGGTGLQEIAHTRTLAWIFDPSKNDEHTLGEKIFVDSLISWIQSHPGKSRVNFPPGDYSVQNVVPEKHTGTDRKGRIDLWIDGTAKVDGVDRVWLVIIEAKVEAELSDHQLGDYVDSAKAWKKKHKKSALNPCFIYLKERRKADRKDGRKADRNAKWVPLDFDTLVELIWEAVPTPCKTEPFSDGFYLVRLYLAGVLSDVVGWKLPIRASVGDAVNYSMFDYAQHLHQKLKISDQP